jgi:hypothetical protein
VSRDVVQQEQISTQVIAVRRVIHHGDLIYVINGHVTPPGRASILGDYTYSRGGGGYVLITYQPKEHSISGRYV